MIDDINDDPKSIAQTNKSLKAACLSDLLIIAPFLQYNTRLPADCD